MRIASLLASGTEILFGLGLGEHVVAISHECDFPPEALDRPRVTFTNVAVDAPSAAIDAQVRTLVENQAALYGIDVALLAELRPDLIVTQAQCDVCAVRYHDVLEAVRTKPGLHGARVLALNPLTLADVFADIRRVGEATGSHGSAERYAAALEARVERVRARTARLKQDERPRVACIEWIEPLMLAGNWMPDLIELAGGRQDFATSGRHSVYYRWDEVTAFDPQVIVLMPCGFDLPRTLQEATVLISLPDWHALAAVRQRRVFAVDGNKYFNRSGPRLVESLEILAHLLHPALCPAPAVPEPAWSRF